MAKAERKISTWCSWHAACQLLPEAVLVRMLGQERVRARGLTEDGKAVDIPSAFWGLGPIVDREASSARSRFLVPVDRYYRIEILIQNAAEAAPTAVPVSAARAAPPTLMESKVWFAEARNVHPRGKRERTIDYAKRLHILMQDAPVNRVWPVGTLQRRLYDKTAQS
jgi:hypothetical protein